MIPKFYVESLPVSPEIVEEDLTATDVGDLVAKCISICVIFSRSVFDVKVERG
jgi:hypothetical protein